jgi:hypothetical protein
VLATFAQDGPAQPEPEATVAGPDITEKGAILAVEKDPLDEIVRVFNKRWFAGWDATAAEQRVKFLNIANHVANNPNYLTQVVNNQDEQNQRLALEKLISQAKRWHGVLSGDAPALVYTPNTGYVGSDSFTFFINDP